MDSSPLAAASRRSPTVERLTRSIPAGNTPIRKNNPAVSHKTEAVGLSRFPKYHQKLIAHHVPPYVLDSNLSQLPDRDVIYVQAALHHQLLHVLITEQIPQVPAYAQDDNLVPKMTSTEQLRSTRTHPLHPTRPVSDLVCDTGFGSVAHFRRQAKRSRSSPCGSRNRGSAATWHCSVTDEE